jgi:putative oxidoreductase
MEIIYIAGRILFAAIFVSSGYSHLTKTKQLGSYAKSMGVPAAEVMTIISGAMILVGGILVILNFLTFLGALLIFFFLIPTSFMMHAFWKLQDPGMKQVQQIMFMKNMSMAGAALMIMYFTYVGH